MASLAKIEFAALDITGKNYLSWINDAEEHLRAKSLADTITKDNTTTDVEKAQAMIFLRRHIDEGLKYEYLTVKDPATLWANLKERFDHQRTVILPKARSDWMHLRLQDFKSVAEYNSALFRISSKLQLCGETITNEDLLEKTFTTFHASNMLLQQQYRERGFKKYSDLITCLLVAEQNNELLVMNHQSRPTGAAPLPTVNATLESFPEVNATSSRGSGRGRRGRRGGDQNRSNLGPRHAPNNLKENKQEIQGASKTTDTPCYHCGGLGHWARTCRVPKHLVDLYHASIKGKEIETNWIDGEHMNPNSKNVSHLEVADFFNDLDGKSSDTMVDEGVADD